MRKRIQTAVAILILTSFLLAWSTFVARTRAQTGPKGPQIGSTGTKIGSKKGAGQIHWQSSTPEKQGMDSATLVKLLEHIEKQGQDVHSLLIIKNGSIVMEIYYFPYTGDTKHILNSCTKSFVSALVGIAIDKGYMRGTNSTVLDFFPEYRISNQDQRRGRITIEHLLTMTSGIEWPH
jgi:CubicO group peptidase (beta-lactamase class C family)